MKIKEYTSTDCTHLAELFYQTVHAVNVKDYTKEQLDAWAPGTVELSVWDASFLEHDTLVAWDKDRIVGFGDMEISGYLDRLYVHKDYQGKGVAKALCQALEERCKADIFTTHASITAKGFFQKGKYTLVKEQQVERSGILLTNYTMEKRRKTDEKED